MRRPVTGECHAPPGDVVKGAVEPSHLFHATIEGLVENPGRPGREQGIDYPSTDRGERPGESATGEVGARAQWQGAPGQRADQPVGLLDLADALNRGRVRPAIVYNGTYPRV